MHRTQLLEQLARYVPEDARDEAQRRRIVDFVRAHADCFERSLAIGHLTGSCWLLDPAGERVLLTHHRKLGQWLQLGGHADGHTDLLEVALREAYEESGLREIRVVSPGIFDLDVHEIPARGDVPAHDHHDVRFLLQAVGDDTFHVSDESHALGWFTPKEVAGLNLDEAVTRMCRKWQRMRGKNEYE